MVSEGSDSDSQYEEQDNKKKISDLRGQRGTVTMQQTKMKNYMDTPGRVFSVSELETRLGLLENYIARFNDIQAQLEVEDPEELKADKRQTYEDAYISVKSKILTLTEQKRPRMSIPSLEATTLVSPIRNASLPKLQINKFTGKFVDWPDFYATFKVLVEDNEHFTNVEKLAYLRGALDEAPLQIINNIGLNDSGFESALGLLKSRYENKRLIFQCHIQALFSLKSMDKTSVAQLREISDSVKSHLRALTSIAGREQIADGLLLQLLRNKVDDLTFAKWEEEAPLHVLPTWDEFSKFLDKRCQTLENTHHGQRGKPEASRHTAHKTWLGSKRVALTASKQENKCVACKGRDHEIPKCSTFIQLTPLERYAEAKRLQLCINCLRQGHSVKNCKSTRCRYCNFKHNTLLHRHSAPQSAEAATTNASHELLTNSSNSTDAAIVMTSLLDAPEVIKAPYSDAMYVVLATAIIEVRSKFGEFIPYRALLDSGSSLHFVSERLAQQLQLERAKTNISVVGIASTSLSLKHKTQLVIKSRIYNYQNTFEALIVPKIANDQPWRTFSTKNWKIPENIVLADPHFNTSGPIDILIGASLFFELLSVGQIRLGDGLPILQKTLLGWVVSGGKALSLGTCLVATEEIGDFDNNLENAVRKFWDIEDCTQRGNPLSDEERSCENHFVKHVKRNISGRFSVRLPFRKDPCLLGDSLDTAKRRFFNLEQRLMKRDNLRQQYSDFLRDYLEAGHMEKISAAMLPKQHYFLPHHCVLKPESSSTKLRVVFDASCKTTSGYSLNDVVMVGPVVQDDLFSILARFRSHKFALTADISKMYRQVRVELSDINMQCILWRDSPQRPLEVFRLATVTYGTSPASYLATRCLQQLAQEENCNYPVGAKVLTRDFYVDDMLTGADTFAELQEIQVEIDQLLRRGCFPLSKWCSNAPELLNSIDDACLEKFLENTDDHVIKTLGMIWHPELDIFRYSYQPTSSSARVTKRAVLSAISRLFDPLGLINPVIVKAKVFLQHLWSLKVSWDESLPQNFYLQWSKFYNELELVNRVQIPRYIFHISPAKIELHIFADASMSAYGACAYVRCVYNETMTCNLLTAKSRVAPLKTLSIPRLELCAALLAAELAARLYKLFRARIEQVYCWSDSSITLSWLSSSPSKWTVFVSNRVAKIQELTENFQWKHISSVNNPADIVSRGASPAEFLDSKIWFHGPAFLRMPNHLWPESSFEVNREIPEGRKTDVTLVSSPANDFLSSSKFCNSYLKFVNTFAYVYRFIHNSKIRSRDSVKRTFGPINLQEFERALMAIIRLIQKEHFREDYCRMSSKRVISRKSPLANLDPFIDNNDIIRVGGRLQNSYLEYDAKHPILLPKCNFTKALVTHFHYRNLHAGVQTLLSIIRNRFWPIGGKGIVKESIRHCVRCCRLRPKVMQQIMGQLPAPRVQPSPVFYHTGVDFCGPFYIKGNIRSRSPTKAYISLFICLSVKAVHMEVVMNLTTEAFLSALTKFISRRPNVAVIYSDNATNFVGGNRELKELKELFNAQQHCNSVQERCKADGIDWKFIPARSPHFGGLWEAAIKQAKHHLRRTLGLESYSLDELQRIVCQVESILNSRPLTPLSNDINDLQALTPGHFIAGGKMAGIPSPRLADVDVRLLTRWQHLQAKVQNFWSRWQNEYLQNLQQRVKWKTSRPNIEIGTMVILKEENMPPLMWRLGRVEDVHRGKDGHIRVVTVRTMMGLVKRAITKVCLLPVDDGGSPNKLEAGTSKAAGSC